MTVPTPTDKNNRPVLTPLYKASETVGKVLKKGDYVVYESTVYPGVTEEECVPVLEQFSGLKYNEDFKKVCNLEVLLQWINGSFVTKINNPGDIDLITFLDFETITKLGSKLDNFKYPNSLASRMSG